MRGYRWDPRHPWDVLTQKMLVLHLKRRLNRVSCVLSGDRAVVGSRLVSWVTEGGGRIPLESGRQMDGDSEGRQEAELLVDVRALPEPSEVSEAPALKLFI